jgi:predicted N-formylglutamate amidohydrolase
MRNDLIKNASDQAAWAKILAPMLKTALDAFG